MLRVVCNFILSLKGSRAHRAPQGGEGRDTGKFFKVKKYLELEDFHVFTQECIIEAFPRGVSFWENNLGK